MQLVSNVTHKLFKILIDNYICKLISIVLAITLFTSISSIGESGYALAEDIFCAYEQCPTPKPDTPKEELKFSQECKEGQDYKIISPPPQEQESDVAVLSIHGGKIELYTSRITSDLSSRNKWDRYDFNGNINNEKCLSLKELSKSNNSNKNFVVLHITSTRFDEPKAVELVMSHKNAVSIHGYERKEKPGLQTICVGGGNKDKIKIFIESVNKKSDKLKGLFDYSLNLVDVPTAAKPGNSTENNSICLVNDKKEPDPLTGRNPKNIVNRNNKNGLQLELNKIIRADLAKGIDDRNDNSPDENQLLRNIIYDAIEEAMRD